MQVADAAAAARVARDRAVRCRLRRIELAAGRRVTAGDVAEARAALEQAIGRAALAQSRLATRLVAYHRPRVVSAQTAPDVPRRDPVALRSKIRTLELGQVWTAYLGLGGHCSQFELDAFTHAALDLGAEEMAVLDQAVWELTEF